MPALPLSRSARSTGTPMAARTRCWEPARSDPKLFGETSLQEEIGGRAANYLGPRNGSQKVLESNKDILSPGKGVDLWYHQLSLVTC